MKVYNRNTRNEVFEVARYPAVGSIKLTAQVNTSHSFDCCFLSVKHQVLKLFLKIKLGLFGVCFVLWVFSLCGLVPLDLYDNSSSCWK